MGWMDSVKILFFSNNSRIKNVQRGSSSSNMSTALYDENLRAISENILSGGGVTENNGSLINDDPSSNDHHAKSRAKFIKRNVSHATTNSQSFRNIQMIMKEKGAVTGNAIVHMLQEVAEEHTVNANNENGVLI